MSSHLDIAVHTDFISNAFVEFFNTFIALIKKPVVLHLPLESQLLKTFQDIFLKHQIHLKVYQIFKERDYIDNYDMSETFNILRNYNLCEFILQRFEKFDPYIYTQGKSARDESILEHSDILILGETLICGKGIKLAEKALEKNKKIYCYVPDYFSFGFVGVEFLLNSDSAKILNFNSL